MLLEPILAVRSTCRPTRWRGRARWSARGAARSSASTRATAGTGWETLRALIPEAEIGDLIIELRSATAGVGAFETKFDHLAELSGRVADTVIAERKKANAA